MSMSKNKVRFYVVLLIVLALFSVVAFAAPFQRGTGFWLSYVCGIVAIALQAYSWTKAFDGPEAKSKFYGFPVARVTTIYMIIQLIVSLVCMALGEKIPVAAAVIADAVLLGVALIGMIAAETARDEVVRQEVVKAASIGTMKALQAKAAAIAGACADPELKKALGSLAEDFHYSDPVSSEATQKLEMKLEVLLDELGENASQELISRTKAVLAERNQLCRMNKG